MTVIRVNKDSVIAYNNTAQGKLSEINAKLSTMLNQTVGVNYTGENAVAFKTKCADIGVDYSNALRADLRSIVESVNTATSDVVDKLGGVRLSLQLQTSPLDRPGIPQGDGTYNADLSLLDALAGDIGRYMNEIEALLDEQLNALKSTDWTGQSKERAVAGVSRFTSAAKSKTSEARTNMTKYITEQVNVLRNA